MSFIIMDNVVSQMIQRFPFQRFCPGHAKMEILRRLRQGSLTIFLVEFEAIADVLLLPGCEFLKSGIELLDADIAKDAILLRPQIVFPFVCLDPILKPDRVVIV